jgi:DNA-binding MarR family transcriptional regulator
MVTRKPPPRTTRPASRTPQPNTDATLVLRQFRLVFNAVKTHFQQVEHQAGLGGAQVWALSVVQAKPGLGMNELARAMDIHQSTASNLVKALSAREMIEVRREGEDRRAVQLHLLPAGKRALKASPGPYAGILPEALQALDPRTLRRLREDLAALIEVLDTDAKGARIPLGGS